MGAPLGNQNNVRGRPPKARALTEILARAAAETVQLVGEERRTARKQILARLVWDAAIFGEAVFPASEGQGAPRPLKAGEWIDLVKWLYGQIDGPPPTQQQVDGKLQIDITYGNDDHPDPAEALPGPGGD